MIYLIKPGEVSSCPVKTKYNS